MSQRDVAIILLNYNGKEELELFLPTLIQNTPDWATIYLIDNASTDDSLLFIKSKFPQISIIEFNRNYGYAGGYAKGLKQIKEEYFVLLNTDIEVTKNWLEPLIDRLESDNQLAAIQPKIKSYNNKNYFEHAGAAGGFIDKFGYPFCRGRVFEEIEKDNGQYDNYTECFWASGACLVIKKSAYYEAGGLDPRFFMHMEEIDLCWRLQRLGYKIACEPNSTVYHVGGASLPYESSKKVFYNFKNNLIMLQKNQPIAVLIWVIPIRCMLDWVASVRLLAKFEFKKIWSIGLAWLYFLIGILNWRKKYNHKTRGEVKNIYQKSIIVDFFLLKQKLYSSLRHENSNHRSQRSGRK